MTHYPGSEPRARAGRAEKVCAIIVSHNSGSAILRTIDAVLPQVAGLIIVDNGSGEETRRHLQYAASLDKVFVHNEAINLGVAAALNRGVEYARSNGYEWLLTMDQDSIAGPRMVETLLACRETHYAGDQAVVSLSPAIVDSYCLGTSKNRKTHQRNVAKLVVITSGHLVKLSAYDKIGTYDERMFIDSVDFEFCLRLKAAGLKTIRCYDAKLFHSVGAKQNVKVLGWQITFTTHLPIRRYYIVRNHVYITSKYLLRFPMWCIRKHLGMLALIFQIVLLETDKQENARQIARGFVDGVRATFFGQW